MNTTCIYADSEILCDKPATIAGYCVEHARHGSDQAQAIVNGYGPVSPELLEQFCADQQARHEALHAADLDAMRRPGLFAVKHYAMSGPKYARIVRESLPGAATERCVVCFIDLATGSIFKADGWKKPARGIRGNVHAADRGASAMTPYGARYAR